MDSLLQCRVTPGQFSDELAVTGDGFSLFAPKSLIERDQEPSTGQPVKAWLHVEVIEWGEGKALVRLPNEAFEIGYYVTVDVGRLRSRRTRQPIQP